MPDTTARCFECRDPIDPHAEAAIVELNPDGSGSAGYHRGHLCPGCEAEFAEKLKQTTGGHI